MALQQPFATLFDNLITVLWSVYGKGGAKVHIGVNQLRWALEFMRCLKVDYGYPESIEKVTNDLEDQLIELYAKIGRKMQEIQLKKEQEQNQKDLIEKKSKTSEGDAPSPDDLMSYNEEDIMRKLIDLKLTIDPVTGEAKYLNELNALGRRKPKNPCPKEKKSSKNYMIGALQKILKKTAEPATKTGVEELIKELKVENPLSKKV